MQNDGVPTNPSPPEIAAAKICLPRGTARSRLQDFGWIKYVLGYTGLMIVVGGLYVMSFGPVMGYFKTHPIKLKTGVTMYTLKGGKESAAQHLRGSVHLPKWVSHFYTPA